MVQGAPACREELVLSRLMSFPNVLIIAHQAFLTKEALAEIARVTVANFSIWGIPNLSRKVRCSWNQW
jgi:lactate dehydrogenase-like 2-hydroxyacid dehydrogenase